MAVVRTGPVAPAPETTALPPQGLCLGNTPVAHVPEDGDALGHGCALCSPPAPSMYPSGASGSFLGAPGSSPDAPACTVLRCRDLSLPLAAAIRGPSSCTSTWATRGGCCAPTRRTTPRSARPSSAPAPGSTRKVVDGSLCLRTARARSERRCGEPRHRSHKSEQEGRVHMARLASHPSHLASLAGGRGPREKTPEGSRCTAPSVLCHYCGRGRIPEARGQGAGHLVRLPRVSRGLVEGHRGSHRLQGQLSHHRRPGPKVTGRGTAAWCSAKSRAFVRPPHVSGCLRSSISRDGRGQLSGEARGPLRVQ